MLTRFGGLIAPNDAVNCHVLDRNNIADAINMTRGMSKQVTNVFYVLDLCINNSNKSIHIDYIENDGGKTS